MDRPDLKERAKLIEKLTKENSKAKEQVEDLLVELQIVKAENERLNSLTSESHLAYRLRIGRFVINRLNEVTNRIGGVIGYELHLNIKETKELIRAIDNDLLTVQHPAQNQSSAPSSEQCPSCATPSGTPDTSPSVLPVPSDTPSVDRV